MRDLSHIDTLLLDMDGVIYRGKSLLPGVADFFRTLDTHLRYAFITNNSILTPAQYQMRLWQMGLPGQAMVVSSALAARHYLEQRFERGTSVYMIGMDGVREALYEDGSFVDTDTTPSVVVVGQDDYLTYDHCRTAARHIANGAAFIGTNPDVTVPSEDDLVPDTGAVLAYLRAATGVEPYIVGKPNPLIFQIAIERLGADPARTLVIGDRLDTDIQGARAANLTSALVFTGVTTPDQLERSPVQPDIVLDSLPGLLHLLK